MCIHLLSSVGHDPQAAVSPALLASRMRPSILKQLKVIVHATSNVGVGIDRNWTGGIVFYPLLSMPVRHPMPPAALISSLMSTSMHLMPLAL